MNIKMLCLGALALSLTSGAAFAAGDGTSALDNQEMMSPFYTDSGMKTMKSDEEFKAAWMAMKQEDREKMSKECDTDTEKLHNDFCAKTKQLGGAN
ncbi:hypothetical protein [Mesorhizobium sp. A623]